MSKEPLDKAFDLWKSLQPETLPPCPMNQMSVENLVKHSPLAARKPVPETPDGKKLKTIKRPRFPSNV